MIKKITQLSALLLLGAFTMNAQSDEYLHCGTNDALAHVFNDHPEIKAAYEAQDRLAEEQDRFDFEHGYYGAARHANPTTQITPPDYIIPVVFHIIHQYGSENISDAQVVDEINILNRDYRLQNADTAGIVDNFDNIMADTKIEFRLANFDPNGNCTNGIDRVYSSLTNNADDNSKLNYWPRNKYLNVWVVKSIGSGAAGYAYLPGTAPSASTDGILILHDYIGSIGTSQTSHSRALTHEIGHFLNLKHVWGNTNNPGVACGDDSVTDTPVTKGYTSCQLTNNMICNGSTHENVQNYMEYSYCSVMFTAGQKTRMTNALNSGSGQRNQLWTSGNLAFTGALNSPQTVCAPVADFTPYNKVMVCAGASVTFDDISYNGHPTSWSWSFPGGTPSSSTDSIPVIQYNTPGVYAVTLTVTNSAGNNSITRTNHVYVSSTSAQYNQWQYFESFESQSTFTSDFVVINPQGNGWTRNTTASYTGTGSVRIQNSTGMVGQVDELVSPSVDYSVITSPQLTFRLAFARRTTTDLDKLRILVSTNCGQTWTQRYLKSGSTLSTITGTTTTSFTPTPNDWRLETVNISSVATASNVRIKFEFTSDGGNNIYIDDINVVGVNGINVFDAGIEHFGLYPNPTEGNTNIAFGLQKTQQTDIQIYDMTGRLITTVYNGTLAVGEHEFPISTEGMSSGIYFVRITTAEGRSATQKMIVK